MVGYSQTPDTLDQKRKNTGTSLYKYYTPLMQLGNGQIEVKFFNNLYTQTRYFDINRNVEEDIYRSNYFTNTTYVLFGLKSKINFGLEVNVRSVRLDDKNSSPLNVLVFANEFNARWRISSFGPKIRFCPFKGINNFAIQSTLMIPTASDLSGGPEGKPFLSYDQWVLMTQFFYDKQFAKKYAMFLESDLLIYIDMSGTSYSFIETPFKALVGNFPNTKWNVYMLSELAPSWGSEGISSFYAQLGGGAKYFITSFLEIEIIVTKFVAGKNSGAGSTYNFGIRYLK